MTIVRPLVQDPQNKLAGITLLMGVQAVGGPGTAGIEPWTS
jgi:hypothetical protein